MKHYKHIMTKRYVSGKLTHRYKKDIRYVLCEIHFLQSFILVKFQSQRECNFLHIMFIGGSASKSQPALPRLATARFLLLSYFIQIITV